MYDDDHRHCKKCATARCLLLKVTAADRPLIEARFSLCKLKAFSIKKQ